MKSGVDAIPDPDSVKDNLDLMKDNVGKLDDVRWLAQPPPLPLSCGDRLCCGRSSCAGPRQHRDVPRSAHQRQAVPVGDAPAPVRQLVCASWPLAFAVGLCACLTPPLPLHVVPGRDTRRQRTSTQRSSGKAFWARTCLCTTLRATSPHSFKISRLPSPVSWTPAPTSRSPCVDMRACPPAMLPAYPLPPPCSAVLCYRVTEIAGRCHRRHSPAPEGAFRRLVLRVRDAGAAQYRRAQPWLTRLPSRTLLSLHHSNGPYYFLMSVMEEDTVQPDDPKAARVWVVRRAAPAAGSRGRSLAHVHCV